uniref:2-keto-4-pentenoate hydratase n=1 Tax=uncultured Altererythrobacter sp. TaxID=500840 RepID=UPI00262E3EB6|nr:2-keto-4-pentenoate hydratase [uncultured Altererythrobacter sp.]
MTAGQQLDLANGGVGTKLTQPEISISEHLLEARTSGRALSKFPGTPPASLNEAYAIQTHSIQHWPGHVSGWKVGGIPEDLRHELGADWLVGPIFYRNIRHAMPGVSTPMPIFDGGFGAIEPELIVKLGATRDQDRMFIGAEIASSPVPDINGYGPTAVICDFGNNNGLLIGPEVVDWATYGQPITVSILIDGKLVGTRTLERLSDQAIPARDFCIEHAARTGRLLSPGMFVSTGAITGIHEAKVDARSSISFAELGEIDLDLTREGPLS